MPTEIFGPNAMARSCANASRFFCRLESSVSEITGVALNVAMNLQPFERINPCGYAGLKTVDLATLGVVADWATVADVLGRRLGAQFTR